MGCTRLQRRGCRALRGLARGLVQGLASCTAVPTARRVRRRARPPPHPASWVRRSLSCLAAVHPALCQPNEGSVLYWAVS